jgi:predicted CopG family antitoxin
MATKTLTIMEDAYDLLFRNKLENESFSEEIRRIMSMKSKKSLKDVFGILSAEEGETMLKDLNKVRAMNIRLLRERLKNESFG